MEVGTMLDREYNRVGGAEVIKLQQLIFEFGAIAGFLEPALTSRREKDRQLRDFCDWKGYTDGLSRARATQPWQHTVADVDYVDKDFEKL